MQLFFSCQKYFATWFKQCPKLFYIFNLSTVYAKCLPYNWPQQFDTYSLNIHKIYKLASSSNKIKTLVKNSWLPKSQSSLVAEINRCLNIPLGTLCYIHSKPSVAAKQPLISCYHHFFIWVIN